MSSNTRDKEFPSLAHERSSPFIIDPAYSTLVDVIPPSDINPPTTWLYGEAQLESYRLSVLRKRAQHAKLKVFYPGKFYTPSKHGMFRVALTHIISTREHHQFSFQCNGHVKVLVGGRLVYESKATKDVHTVEFQKEHLSQSAEDFLVIDISTTTSVDEPAAPPCLCIVAPTSCNDAWKWSVDGNKWTCARDFQTSNVPHLVENPTVSVAAATVEDDKLVYDFGVEVFGHVVIQCAEKATLYIGESMAEVLNDNPSHFEQSTELMRATDTAEWQSVHLLAFRYLRVADSTKSEIKQIACKAQFHPVTYHGAFATFDSMLNQVWMSSAYTLRLCMHDFLVDGIKRDRLPWTGDLAVSMLANAYTFGETDITCRTLTVLGRAGIAESDINGIVDYSLWWIVCQDLYQLYFGDKEHLDREWSRIREAFVCLIGRCNENGFLQVKDSDWVFIDWVDGEKATALQILWWWTLDCACRLAQRVNDDETNIQLQTRRANLKEKIVSLCWDEDAGLWLSKPAVEKKYSRHANILAVVSGLSSSESIHIREALHAKSLDPVGTPYMKTFECLALARLGAQEKALASMRSYWGKMIENGATTFWEAFSEDEPVESMPAFYGRPFGRSLCHAWSAGPCFVLPDTVLGIRPLADGWSEWTCSPNVGNLEWVTATVPTPHGCIEVEASPNSLRLVVPKGTTLTVDKSSFVGPDVISRPIYSIVDGSEIDANTIKDWSAPYRGWHYYSDHVIPPKPNIKGHEDCYMTDVPTVFQLAGDEKWYMSFIGFNGEGYQSFIAESDDLLNWTNARLAMGFGEFGEFDYGGCVLGAFLYKNYDIMAPRILKKKNDKYWSLYGAYSKQGKYEIDPGYEGIASSDDGLTWNRAKDQPILSVHDDGVKDWERDSIYQPWLVEHEGRYYNFYNAKRMPKWVEQIGLATSTDLYEWERDPMNPVLHVRPDGFDAEFVADGKVFKDGDHWTMFYFGVGKGGAHIMVAFSRDLTHWTADPDPLYKAGGNPSGLDSQYAHKISLVWNPKNETWYMFYDAVGEKGRGIGLITTKPLSKPECAKRPCAPRSKIESQL